MKRRILSILLWACIIAHPFQTSQASEVINLSATEARDRLMNDPSMLALDVREPYEFSSGHIDGAINMPWRSGYLASHQ